MHTYAYHLVPRAFASKSVISALFSVPSVLRTISYAAKKYGFPETMPSPLLTASSFGLIVKRRFLRRCFGFFVTYPPAAPDGHLSSSYSHASIFSFFAFSLHAFTKSINSSLKYFVAIPDLECIWKPPNPMLLSCSICQSSSSLSSSVFQAQNGVPLYSLVGFLNSSISSFFSLFLL